MLHDHACAGVSYNNRSQTKKGGQAEVSSAGFLTSHRPVKAFQGKLKINTNCRLSPEDFCLHFVPAKNKQTNEKQQQQNNKKS